MNVVEWQWFALDSAVFPASIECEIPLVGRLDLDCCPAALLQHSDRILDTAERRRRDGFRRADDATRFTAARIALRSVLGGLLQRDPATLPIEIAEKGKPALNLSGAPEFNLSHCGSTLLLALHASQVVGVDIERVRQGDALRSLYRQVLTDTEVASLEQHATSQARGFATYWTIKEAVLKASGRGLAQSMQTLEVDLSASEPRVRDLAGHYSAAHELHIRSWQVADYAAALAWYEPTGI